MGSIRTFVFIVEVFRLSNCKDDFFGIILRIKPNITTGKTGVRVGFSTLESFINSSLSLSLLI